MGDRTDALRETLPVTLDQRRVIVSANVEILDDLPLIKEHGAEGIGLLRTEYLFLNQDVSPDEEQHRPNGEREERRERRPHEGRVYSGPRGRSSSANTHGQSVSPI